VKKQLLQNEFDGALQSDEKEIQAQIDDILNRSDEADPKKATHATHAESRESVQLFEPMIGEAPLNAISH